MNYEDMQQEIQLCSQ